MEGLEHGIQMSLIEQKLGEMALTRRQQARRGVERAIYS
jgi:hypothetical protein